MASTKQIARDAKREIKQEDWIVDDENPENLVRRLYLGRTWVISGNEGWTPEFAERLENALSRAGLSLEGGMGDPTDQYACQYRERNK
jgi:hypothetical protein